MRKKTTQGPSGWELERTGKGPVVVSSHRTQADAVVAGRRAATGGSVQLTVLGRPGRISSKDSYALERRVIKESVGQPSVSRSKIAAAAREIVRSSQRRVS